MKSLLNDDEFLALHSLNREGVISYRKYDHYGKRWIKPRRKTLADLAKRKLCDELVEPVGLHGRSIRYTYTTNDAGEKALAAETCFRELQRN